MFDKMTTFEAENNSDAGEKDFIEKSRLTLTVIFASITFLVLMIQIMPYFYGGVVGHSHTGGGGCVWPNNCEGVKNF